MDEEKEKNPIIEAITEKGFLPKALFLIIIFILLFIAGIIVGHDKFVKDGHEYAEKLITTFCGEQFVQENLPSIRNFTIEGIHGNVSVELPILVNKGELY